MVNRKLRYNIKTDTSAQAYFPHHWTVALVNEPREIERIKERIISQLAPVNDLYDNYELQIPNSNGLQCYIFSFDSTKGKFLEPSKIYDSSDFKRDRDLRDTSDSKLEKYVQRELLK